MSEARRMTRMIYDALVSLALSDKEWIFPGDITSYLRSQNYPVGIWYVNSELFRLEQLGVVRFDNDTGLWSLIEGAGFDALSRQCDG